MIANPEPAPRVSLKRRRSPEQDEPRKRAEKLWLPPDMHQDSNDTAVSPRKEKKKKKHKKKKKKRHKQSSRSTHRSRSRSRQSKSVSGTRSPFTERKPSEGWQVISHENKEASLQEKLGNLEKNLHLKLVDVGLDKKQSDNENRVKMEMLTIHKKKDAKAKSINELLKHSRKPKKPMMIQKIKISTKSKFHSAPPEKRTNAMMLPSTISPRGSSPKDSLVKSEPVQTIEQTSQNNRDVAMQMRAGVPTMNQQQARIQRPVQMQAHSMQRVQQPPEQMVAQHLQHLTQQAQQRRMQQQQRTQPQPQPQQQQPQPQPQPQQQPQQQPVQQPQAQVQAPNQPRPQQAAPPQQQQLTLQQQQTLHAQRLQLQQAIQAQQQAQFRQAQFMQMQAQAFGNPFQQQMIMQQRQVAMQRQLLLQQQQRQQMLIQQQLQQQNFLQHQMHPQQMNPQQQQMNMQLQQRQINPQQQQMNPQQQQLNARPPLTPQQQLLNPQQQKLMPQQHVVKPDQLQRQQIQMSQLQNQPQAAPGVNPRVLNQAPVMDPNRVNPAEIATQQKNADPSKTTADAPVKDDKLDGAPTPQAQSGPAPVANASQELPNPNQPDSANTGPISPPITAAEAKPEVKEPTQNAPQATQAINPAPQQAHAQQQLLQQARLLQVQQLQRQAQLQQMQLLQAQRLQMQRAVIAGPGIIAVQPSMPVIIPQVPRTTLVPVSLAPTVIQRQAPKPPKQFPPANPEPAKPVPDEEDSAELEELKPVTGAEPRESSSAFTVVKKKYTSGKSMTLPAKTRSLLERQMSPFSSRSTRRSSRSSSSSHSRSRSPSASLSPASKQKRSIHNELLKQRQTESKSYSRSPSRRRKRHRSRSYSRSRSRSRSSSASSSSSPTSKRK